MFFIYAGGRVPNVSRASLYWPHRASVQYGGRSLPYFIVEEGGSRMTDISVFCRYELGHSCSAYPISTPDPSNPAARASGK